MRAVQADMAGGVGVFEQEVRGAVRRDNSTLEGHSKFGQSAGCMLHDFPVRAGAHHDANQWSCHSSLEFVEPVRGWRGKSPVGTVGSSKTTETVG
jgi:hypothetical protein